MASQVILGIYFVCIRLNITYALAITHASMLSIRMASQVILLICFVFIRLNIIYALATTFATVNVDYRR